MWLQVEQCHHILTKGQGMESRSFSTVCSNEALGLYAPRRTLRSECVARKKEQRELSGFAIQTTLGTRHTSVNSGLHKISIASSSTFFRAIAMALTA